MASSTRDTINPLPMQHLTKTIIFTTLESDFKTLPHFETRTDAIKFLDKIPLKIKSRDLSDKDTPRALSAIKDLAFFYFAINRTEEGFALLDLLGIEKETIKQFVPARENPAFAWNYDLIKLTIEMRKRFLPLLVLMTARRFPECIPAFEQIAQPPHSILAFIKALKPYSLAMQHVHIADCLSLCTDILYRTPNLLQTQIIHTSPTPNGVDIFFKELKIGIYDRIRQLVELLRYLDLSSLAENLLSLLPEKERTCPLYDITNPLRWTFDVEYLKHAFKENAESFKQKELKATDHTQESTPAIIEKILQAFENVAIPPHNINPLIEAFRLLIKTDKRPGYRITATYLTTCLRLLYNTQYLLKEKTQTATTSQSEQKIEDPLESHPQTVASIPQPSVELKKCVEEEKISSSHSRPSGYIGSQQVHIDFKHFPAFRNRDDAITYAQKVLLKNEITGPLIQQYEFTIKIIVNWALFHFRINHPEEGFALLELIGIQPTHLTEEIRQEIQQKNNTTITWDYHLSALQQHIETLSTMLASKNMPFSIIAQLKEIAKPPHSLMPFLRVLKTMLSTINHISIASCLNHCLAALYNKAFLQDETLTSSIKTSNTIIIQSQEEIKSTTSSFLTTQAEVDAYFNDPNNRDNSLFSKLNLLTKLGHFEAAQLLYPAACKAYKIIIDPEFISFLQRNKDHTPLKLSQESAPTFITRLKAELDTKILPQLEARLKWLGGFEPLNEKDNLRFIVDMLFYSSLFPTEMSKYTVFRPPHHLITEITTEAISISVKLGSKKLFMLVRNFLKPYLSPPALDLINIALNSVSETANKSTHEKFKEDIKKRITTYRKKYRNYLDTIYNETLIAAQNPYHLIPLVNVICQFITENKGAAHIATPILETYLTVLYSSPTNTLTAAHTLEKEDKNAEPIVAAKTPAPEKKWEKMQPLTPQEYAELTQEQLEDLSQTHYSYHMQHLYMAALECKEDLSFKAIQFTLFKPTDWQNSVDRMLHVIYQESITNSIPILFMLSHFLIGIGKMTHAMQLLRFIHKQNLSTIIQTKIEALQTQSKTLETEAKNSNIAAKPFRKIKLNESIPILKKALVNHPAILKTILPLFKSTLKSTPFLENLFTLLKNTGPEVMALVLREYCFAYSYSNTIQATETNTPVLAGTMHTSHANKEPSSSTTNTLEDKGISQQKSFNKRRRQEARPSKKASNSTPNIEVKKIEDNSLENMTGVIEKDSKDETVREQNTSLKKTINNPVELMEAEVESKNPVKLISEEAEPSTLAPIAEAKREAKVITKPSLPFQKSKRVQQLESSGLTSLQMGLTLLTSNATESAAYFNDAIHKLQSIITFITAEMEMEFVTDEEKIPLSEYCFNEVAVWKAQATLYLIRMTNLTTMNADERNQRRVLIQSARRYLKPDNSTYLILNVEMLRTNFKLAFSKEDVIEHAKELETYYQQAWFQQFSAEQRIELFNDCAKALKEHRDPTATLWEERARQSQNANGLAYSLLEKSQSTYKTSEKRLNRASYWNRRTNNPAFNNVLVNNHKKANIIR